MLQSLTKLYAHLVFSTKNRQPPHRQRYRSAHARLPSHDNPQSRFAAGSQGPKSSSFTANYGRCLDSCKKAGGRLFITALLLS